MQSILVIVQWQANNTMKIVRVISIMALVVCKNLTVRDMVTTTSSRKEDLLTITTTITTTGVGIKTVHKTCNVSILMITVVETTVISTITIIRETSTTIITREISTTNSNTSTGKTIQEVITRIETSTKETCVVVMVGDMRTVLTVLTTIKGLLKVIKTSN